jgi:hypothetical protein
MSRDWTDVERGLVRDLYPTGGAKACLPWLPDRTAAQVHEAVVRWGIRYVGLHPKTRDARPFGLPTQDWSAADDAARTWRGPVQAGPLVATLGRRAAA